MSSMAVCVGVPLAVGALTGLATRKGPESDWYASLAKPDWMPPAGAFAPVWTLLYVLMGLACWQVWSTGRMPAEVQFLFGLQLALNAAWSLLFFNARSLGFALADVVALLVAVAMTTAGMYKVDRLAGYLMIPYLLWVVFATVLTLDIYIRNPGKH